MPDKLNVGIKNERIDRMDERKITQVWEEIGLHNRNAHKIQRARVMQ